jgi:hypothetical protein
VGGLRTEYEFTLPKGFVDGEGRLHRHGTMRLATARDEIEPLRDPRIDGPEDPYLTVLVLARVITSLGTLDGVTVTDVENLFAADLAFLQDLYGIINFGDPADVVALQRSVLGDAVDDLDDLDDLDDDVAAPDDELGTGPDLDTLAGDAPVAANGTEPAPVTAGTRRRRDRIEEIHRDAP